MRLKASLACILALNVVFILVYIGKLPDVGIQTFYNLGLETLSFHGDSDENKLYKMLDVLNNRPCTINTPVLLVQGGGGGFGNIFINDFAAFHKAFLLDVSVVIPNSTVTNGWPVHRHELFRTSSCQKLFDREGASFTTVYRGGDGMYMFLRHPEFVHKPLIWYLQRLGDYYMVPSEILAKKINRRLNLITKWLTPIYEDADVTIPQKIDPQVLSLEHWRGIASHFAPLSKLYPERFVISLHIRRGDACTTRNVNTNRPPCQNVDAYIKSVKHMMKIHRKILVYLATDASEVIPEFKRIVGALNHDIKVIYLNFDRSKYVPIANDAKIEDFVAQHEKMKMYLEWIFDMSFLSSGDMISGQYYSSMLSLALFGSHAQEYESTDLAFPCLRGGCPTGISDDCSDYQFCFANDWLLVKYVTTQEYQYREHRKEIVANLSEEFWAEEPRCPSLLREYHKHFRLSNYDCSSIYKVYGDDYDGLCVKDVVRDPTCFF